MFEQLREKKEQTTDIRKFQFHSGLGNGKLVWLAFRSGFITFTLLRRIREEEEKKHETFSPKKKKKTPRGHSLSLGVRNARTGECASIIIIHLSFRCKPMMAPNSVPFTFKCLAFSTPGKTWCAAERKHGFSSYARHGKLSLFSRIFW